MAAIERQIGDEINASTDRVVLNHAFKHLGCGGNYLLFMGQDSMRGYPLNRYVVDRDCNDNVLEIVTKETISKQVYIEELTKEAEKRLVDPEWLKSSWDREDDPDHGEDEIDVYTHVVRRDGRFFWHQEVESKIIPSTKGNAPVNASPWIPLRFNVVDGEAYGRGRAEEFLGDLKSLEGLMQALVEGSAVSAKVLFLLDPGSTTKANTVANTPNGGIIAGKEKDITVVQVGKAMDLKTAESMVLQLAQRISEGFLVMNVRDSERTTAEEVRMTQMELESQLGGLFSLLTVELLLPYLRRKMAVLQRAGKIERLPNKFVKPVIVAGLNAVGRGYDAQAMLRALTATSQVFGPDAVTKFVNPLVAIKRLFAAEGIDLLGLVRTQEQVDAQQQQNINIQKDLSLTNQAGALARAPMLDPTKNPNVLNGSQTDQGAADASVQPQPGPSPSV
jgi:hypothetical protein